MYLSLHAHTECLLGCSLFVDITRERPHNRTTPLLSHCDNTLLWRRFSSACFSKDSNVVLTWLQLAHCLFVLHTCKLLHGIFQNSSTTLVSLHHHTPPCSPGVPCKSRVLITRSLLNLPFNLQTTLLCLQTINHAFMSLQIVIHQIFHVLLIAIVFLISALYVLWLICTL